MKSFDDRPPPQYLDLYFVTFNFFNMKKILQLLVCLCLIICTATKCKKSAPEPDSSETLPPFTTTGVEKLGCLINGKVWVTGAPFFLSNPNTTFKIDTVVKHMGIFAQKEKDQKSINFACNFNKVGIGDYKIKYIKYIFIDYIKCVSNPDYELDTTATNILKIKFIDMQKRIVAGEFKFTAINKICNDTAVITDGRFDLNFIFN